MELRTRRIVAGLTALAASTAGVVATGGVSAAAPKQDRAQNVIYMVGDGMGVTHRNAARLRFHGADGQLAMDSLPALGSTSTYSVVKGSEQPNLVPDSAATGTSWATGIKTYNGAIGKDTRGNDIATIMEQAKAAGLRTGNVSTAEITDASPAAMMAHVSARGCQGPSTQMTTSTCRAVDGTQETPIAQQISRNGVVDVLLGGGLRRFEPADQKAFEDQGYTVLGNFGSQTTATRAELQAVDSGKVVGLFNRGNLTVEKHKLDNPGSPKAQQEPTLSELTQKAIELLGAPDFAGRSEKGKGRNDKAPGFLLQVESALVDKRSHANDAAQTLEEMREFDDAVAVAKAFAERDGNTLVVVTADHECAGFNIIGKGSFTNAEATSPPGNTDSSNTSNNSDLARDRGSLDPERSKGIYNAPGATDPDNFAPATFRTADDPDVVRDGTAEASLWLSYLSGNHTGADIPTTAFGPGSGQFVGFHDNTDHYRFMTDALGLS